MRGLATTLLDLIKFIKTSLFILFYGVVPRQGRKGGGGGSVGLVCTRQGGGLTTHSGGVGPRTRISPLDYPSSSI